MGERQEVFPIDQKKTWKLTYPLKSWCLEDDSFPNLKWSHFSGHSKGTPTYPWSIPQTSPNPQMKGIPNHKLLVGGLGYAPGVCWKVLRDMLNFRAVHCRSFLVIFLPSSSEASTVSPCDALLMVRGHQKFDDEPFGAPENLLKVS